jgi:FkbM family methyltransferase
MQADIICDIGCFNGDDTAWMANLCPSARVVGFEANKRNFDQFLKHTDNFQPNCEFHNLAISNKQEILQFYELEAEDTPADWRRAAGSLNKRNDDTPYRNREIKAVRLDDFFKSDISASKLFGLWIDVEGALDAVLHGAEEVLKRTLIIHAEMEHHAFWKDQMLAKDLVPKLENSGFKLIGDSYVPDAYPQSNILFIKKDWLELLAGRLLQF